MALSKTSKFFQPHSEVLKKEEDAYRNSKLGLERAKLSLAESFKGADLERRRGESQSKENRERLKTMVALEQARHQNQVTTPNENDVLANAFGEFSKTVRGPRGNNIGLLSGLSEGIELGLKREGVRQRKEESNKLNQVLDWAQQANQRMEEQIGWYKDQERVKDQASNAALTYNQFLYDGRETVTPQQAKEFGQYVFDNQRRSGLLPEGAIFLGPVAGDEKVINVKLPNGQIQAIDTQDLLSPDARTQLMGPIAQTLKQQKPPEISQMNQQQMMPQEALQEPVAKREPLVQEEAPSPQLENEGNIYTPENGYIPRQVLSKEEEKKTVALMDEETKKSKPRLRVLQDVNELEKLIDEDPEIGKSFVGALLNSDDPDTALATFQRKIAGVTNKDQAARYLKMQKLIANLNLEMVRGFSGKQVTDILKRTIKEALPNVTGEAEAFKYVLNQIADQTAEDVAESQARKEAWYQGYYFDPSLSGEKQFKALKQERETRRNLSSAGNAKETSSLNMVTVSDPETGETIEIPEGTPIPEGLMVVNNHA